MSVVELTKETFEQEVLAAKVPVLIDFWAGWCGPCMKQSPIVDAVAEELGDKVKVCKVNVDEQASLALDYQVVSIPTLVFMNKGMFQERMVGLQDKQTIVDYLNTLIDEK
jgi:thioredoxin 1